MDYREILSVALGALRANKLRSFLTMLGVVIGVAAVIAMVALGRGAQESVKERIASLGTTLLTVIPNQARGAGGIAGGDTRVALTMSDSDALTQRSTILSAIEPEMSRQLQVQYGNQNTNTSIVGTTSNYADVRKFNVAAGRMFSTQEDASRARVAVVGSQVLEDLGVASPYALIGEPIRIGGIAFTVVGALESKGQGAGFANPDDQVLIPIQTARYRVMGTDRLRTLNVLAPTEDQIGDAMVEIQRILRREHRLRAGQPDDFQIRSQADFLNTLGQTTQVFTLLLAGIAAVSLLVGGIGIMNIMLVSVTERTREIGIRKALGATRINILFQFLIEAIVLCMVGGIAGILVGAGMAEILQVAFHWNISIAPASVLVSFFFSAAVGIVFGVWPARRASGLDPIIALRYE